MKDFLYNDIFKGFQKQLLGSILRNRRSLEIYKTHRKELSQSLFLINLAGLCPSTLLKQELWQRIFSYDFCETYIRTLFIEHLRLTASGFFLKSFSLIKYYLNFKNYHLKQIFFSNFFETTSTLNSK